MILEIIQGKVKNCEREEILDESLSLIKCMDR